MFKTDTEAIYYIEHQIHKRDLSEYKKILEKYHISTSGLKFIHVTGTNGKGSTVSYLRCLLNQAGKKVGTFTSPYLVSYHDRICIDQIPISSEDLLKIVNEYEEIIVGEQLSKFEIDVLIMLIYFQQQKVDYAIVEVGIGGRKDKTNVIASCLSLITNIGYDHMPSLGNTLAEVAYQKAGIIKKNTAVITTIQDQKCLDVVTEEAMKQNAKMVQVTIPKVEHYPICFDYQGIQDIELGNVALYQVQNAVLALEAFSYLGESLSQDKIKEALFNMKWPGRFERFDYQNHVVYIDGAHNIDGIHALHKTLQARKGTKKTIIFSALRDKDYPLMITFLQQYYDVYLTVFEDERKVEIDDLKAYPFVFASFEEAMRQALQQEGEIIITGSLHFISYVRNKLKQSYEKSS